MSATLKLSVSVVIERDNGGFHAYCPALKGLHVDGKTEKEAIKNLREAVMAYLTSLAKHRDPLPLGPDLTLDQEAPPPRGKLQNLSVEWPLAQMSGTS